jgi:GcrA cell cycle regulator
MSEENKFTDKALMPDEHEAVSDTPEPVALVEISPRQPSGIAKSSRARATRKLVTTLTLSSRTCRWPIGDPSKPDFHYCGELPQSGRVYCGMHEDMSYQTPQRRKAS